MMDLALWAGQFALVVLFTRRKIQAADEITRLRSDLKEALEALAWYVEHDDTNETLPHNAFYIEGRNKALSVLKKARGEA